MLFAFKVLGIFFGVIGVLAVMMVGAEWFVDWFWNKLIGK